MYLQCNAIIRGNMKAMVYGLVTNSVSSVALPSVKMLAGLYTAAIKAIGEFCLVLSC